MFNLLARARSTQILLQYYSTLRYCTVKRREARAAILCSTATGSKNHVQGGPWAEYIKFGPHDRPHGRPQSTSMSGDTTPKKKKKKTNMA